MGLTESQKAYSSRVPASARGVSLSVILPVYNERARVVEGLEQLRAAVDEYPLGREQVEVILADDGSSDGTGNLAESALAGFMHATIVRLPVNRGKGAAVRAGVAIARGSKLVYMDVDMAVPPRNITDLLCALSNADVAIGSRTHDESSIQSATAHRIVMGRTFHRIARTTARVPYRDTQCGFKAFRTPVARLLFHLLSTERFAFDVELLALAGRLDFSVVEVPVFWRHVPGSRIRPLIDPFSMLADLVRLRNGRVSPPDVMGTVVPSAPGVHDAPERVRRVVGTTLPVVPSRQGLLVLFPLCDATEVDRLTDLLRREFPELLLEPVSLSVSDLAALRRSQADSGALWVGARAPEAPADGQPLGEDFVCGVGEGESSASGS
jgi:hypothetical protein